jgi:hypothetical protein
MKTTIKAILTATALSTAGMCLSVSNLAVAKPEADEFNYVIVNKYSTSSTADKDLLPSTDLFTTESFAQIFDKPLVKIPLDNIPAYRTGNSGKSSNFFAISTLLNDKLQQLIAKFTQNTPSYSLDENGDMALNTTKRCNSKRS